MVGKTKAHLKRCRDLEEIGVRHELHSQEGQSSKAHLPPATFYIGHRDKITFGKVLKSVRVLDGYASNIYRYIQTKRHKITGLKSHNLTILLHHLL